MPLRSRKVGELPLKNFPSPIRVMASNNPNNQLINRVWHLYPGSVHRTARRWLSMNWGKSIWKSTAKQWVAITLVRRYAAVCSTNVPNWTGFALRLVPSNLGIFPKSTANQNSGPVYEALAEAASAIWLVISTFGDVRNIYLTNIKLMCQNRMSMIRLSHRRLGLNGKAGCLLTFT